MPLGVRVLLNSGTSPQLSGPSVHCLRLGCGPGYRVRQAEQVDRRGDAEGCGEDDGGVMSAGGADRRMSLLFDVFVVNLRLRTLLARALSGCELRPV